ncbi:MAG: nucleotidyltransferase, partial [Alphaproteobacteria bacterium]|nr:nucleotidyltransferase [Alphaproteobacteria bacterium]
MSKEPTLVIMAAGMGSRYGGLKQMDPITEEGEIILDFSLYDAVMAGFKKVVFIIKKEIEEDFILLVEG